jgi:cytochrome c biogenesis protein
VVQGDTFVNNLASYDSFSPGPLFDENTLQPFRVRLDNFEVTYDFENPANLGTPTDFRASVTTELADGTTSSGLIRVNYPLEVPGANLYLTGNGFAPVVTVRDGEGNVAYGGPVVFLPQDGNYTSIGVIKVPDALPQQLGLVGFFYPTADTLASGAYTSIYPEPIDPLLTLNVYTGDLGLDAGVPRNVYALDTSDLTLIAGRDGPNPALELRPGESAQLPDGLGSVTFDGVRRFVSLDIAFNPGGIWILISALLAMFAVGVSLLTKRRRIWVRVSEEKIEFAGLARSEDPALAEVVEDFIVEFRKLREEAK